MMNIILIIALVLRRENIHTDENKNVGITQCLCLIRVYFRYFALCAFGGVLSCGITHTAVTPLDLVKCRLQVTSDKFFLCLFIKKKAH